MKTATIENRKAHYDYFIEDTLECGISLLGDETRVRTLLAHKREIKKLDDAVKVKGITLVPLKIYFSDQGKCKVLIGICKGKKLYDKRESLKNKQVQLDIARNVK